MSAAEYTDNYWLDGMVGACPQMREVFELIERVAVIDVVVLITGESGTGKEMVARAVHRRSGRGEGPFIAVNTGAIPPELVATELFGHERGAFTDAVSDRPGLFELANEGTLFLDEVSTMDQNTQVSLLRVLETHEFQRIGADRSRRTDTRVLAATNEDLRAAIQQGCFREDLYHRLNIFRIDLPPLRRRGDDVALLAESFLRDFSARHGKNLTGFAQEATDTMRRYTWPGNVRELQNAVLHAVVSAEGEAVRLADLPDTVAGRTNGSEQLVVEIGSTISDAERELIVKTLDHVHGNKRQAAKVLGISRKALYNKLKSYHLSG
jgi:DNA-binding NtrC family response regulator